MSRTEIAKQTPEPWTVEPFPYEGEPTDSGEYVIQSDYGPIAVIDVAGRPHSQMQANARLIAAAPDLLTVLHEVLDYYVDVNEGYTDEEERGVVARAEAAIRKAEGRS